MKKFLISMAVSITFITIGFTSLLFEFHSFEIVELNEKTNQLSQTIAVADILYNDRIYIEIEDSSLYTDIQDDLTQTDEIIIQYPENVEFEEKSNKLVLEGKGHSNQRQIRDHLDIFMEGLKEKKLYIDYNDDYSNRIEIHCSPEVYNKIRVNHD